MFYYPNVLQRHTGCFSTVWLAATRGIQVTRRELLRVNVKLTCRDILNYVTAQVPSLEPNQPKPRFSLYLSSQLQYGVVVVYHKQCIILLEEIQHTIDRLLRTKKFTHIDMAESERFALDVPDFLYMMEEAEGAQDPFFGLMESHQLCSPYKVHQADFVIEELASEHSIVLRNYTALNNDGLSSSPTAITLLEKEQPVFNTAEDFEGDDLPEATVREIDMLMDQTDHFRNEVEQTEERTRDHGVVSSITKLKETTLGTELDSVRLLDEERSQPMMAPRAAVTLEMTPLHVAMPTPPHRASTSAGHRSDQSLDEGVVVPPLRKHAGRRRRQLVFADPDVQIPDSTMQEQIGDPLTQTVGLYEVLLNSSVTKRAAPAQLFSAPCGSLHLGDLLSLWKQQASLVVLPGSGEKEKAELESEQDMEILRTERKRRKETHSESGLQSAEGSSALDVILDVSKGDRSGSDVITPVSRWSPQEEVHPPMDPISEENIEMPEAQADVEDSYMLSWITSTMRRLGRVTFDSLLPPQADRPTAAHKLYKLLQLLSARQVTVRQAEPYGRIVIDPAAVRTDV